MSNIIVADKRLVAYCGLYCGACKSYLKGKCKGCRENIKADKWCKIKKCCGDNTYENCADCKIYNSTLDCKMFNNTVSKLFSLIFGSNRNASIIKIKELGTQGYAEEMASGKTMTVK